MLRTGLTGYGREHTVLAIGVMAVLVITVVVGFHHGN